MFKTESKLLKKIFIILNVFLVQVAIAQESSIVFNKSIENNDNSFYETLVYAKEDSSNKLFVAQKLFSNSSTPKGYYIKRFSDKMVLEERIKIDIENNEIRGMFINKTKLFLIQFEYSREEKAYNINLLSSEKTSFDFKKSTLFTVDRRDIDKYDKFGERENSTFPNYEDFNPGGVLTSSENGKFYCYSLRLKRKKTTQNLFLVFDENFKLLSSNMFEDKSKGNVLVTNLIITDDGVIYFLSRKYDKDIPISKIITSRDNYTIKLNKLNSEKFEEINFNNNEFNGGSAYITAENEKIFIYGYFSENQHKLFNSAGFSGVFNCVINSKTQKISHFSKYFFKDMLNNKRDKPVDEVGRDLAFKNVFIDNGEIIYNSEVHYTDGNNNSCMHFGNIISSKFNYDGKLTWLNTINKNQTACFGWGKTVNFSFISLYNSDKIYYLTNYDYLKNDDINNDNSLCNLITVNTSTTIKTQSKLTKGTIAAIYFKNFINLSNLSVLTEGMDFSGQPILVKVSVRN